MIARARQLYFISYVATSPDGRIRYGNSSFHIPPISEPEQLQDLEHKIATLGNHKSVAILNWRRYEEPE